MCCQSLRAAETPLHSVFLAKRKVPEVDLDDYLVTLRYLVCYVWCCSSNDAALPVCYAFGEERRCDFRRSPVRTHRRTVAIIHHRGRPNGTFKVLGRKRTRFALLSAHRTIRCVWVNQTNLSFRQPYQTEQQRWLAY